MTISLKSKIKDHCDNSEFIHHKWYFKYHLEIVDKISKELCEIYKDADKEIVDSMVWLHDIGKIVPNTNQEETIIEYVPKLLKELNYDLKHIKKVLEYILLLEKKMEYDLNEAPIEVKIISSADAASHYYGPFYPLWWYENSTKTIEELIQDNRKKDIKDWERKIVLPEVKELVAEKHKFILEMTGDIPERFFNYQ